MISEIDKEEDACSYYTMAIDDAKNCDIEKWYKEFKDISPPTIIMSIPQEIMDYVMEHYMNVYAFRDASNFDRTDRSQLTLRHDSDDSSDSSNGYSQHSDTNQDYEEDEPPPLMDSTLIDISKFYEEKIDNFIKDLGGVAIPKLNWATPNDISGGSYSSIKCIDSNDVLSVIKLSPKVNNVVNNGFKYFNIDAPSQIEFHLALRKLVVMETDMEFRCFVCDERLTAITPRHIQNGSVNIANQRDSIIIDIHDFFWAKVYGRYPESFYVFDVVRLGPGQVTLIDFGVFGLPTDPLLFTYRELGMLMEEISSNIQSKPPGRKSKSGLLDVFIFGEPYFRYLVEDYTYSPRDKKIAPSNIVTYLREMETE